jgi:hypothetical protein
VREGLWVEPFTTTNRSKAQAIEALALAFERSDIRILNDRVLVSELTAYQTERLPSGLMRYGAPPSQHDDCVMALAMAWSSVSGQLGPEPRIRFFSFEDLGLVDPRGYTRAF